MELLIPDLMEIIIDEKAPAGELNEIYLYGGAMLACAAASLMFNLIANRMSAHSSGTITKHIRRDLFVKLESLSEQQMDRLTVSSAESRLTSDTYNINQLLSRIQRMGVRPPILLIGGILMMLRMNAKLTLVLLALLPIIGVLVYLVTKYSVPVYTSQQTVLDKVVRVMQENITGVRVIKALSKTEYEQKRFNEVNNDLAQTAFKAGTITSVTNPTANLILNFGLIVVVVIGAFQVNAGEIKSGVIIAFLQYFTMILNAMLGVTRIFILVSKGQASAVRVAQVLSMPEDLMVQPQQTVQANAPHIEFRDVSFSYTGTGMNLSHLSFRLEHGQTLGIIGPTGSGKSTILKLLLRLYDTNCGQIFIDGQDIRTIATEELRKKFGIVFQNDFLAEGTIADNIVFFRDIGDAAVTRAAKAAQADFIEDKENGMAAAVAVRGNNLSGGQKQRLLIARALAGAPEILVLDDASSALDYQTDAHLRRALREQYRNTTTVLVAQRVSSLRHADLILVMEDGEVCGAGNHEQLMQNCEQYRSIAKTQMGDGRECVSCQVPE